MDSPALSSDTKECPYCAEIIKEKAKICRFCGKELPLGKSTGEDDSNIGIENRILCSDGSCVGVVGSNGRCKLCGKVYVKGGEKTINKAKIPWYKTKKPWYKRWWIILLLLWAFTVIAINISNTPKQEKNQTDEAWRGKYLFVKAMDEETFKMGLFDKVTMGTSDRVEITLNMQDETAYGVALQLMPKFKEAGFKVLRLKHNKSDRYEDHRID